MTNLTRASHELFRRTPDECFPSLSVLSQHCQWQKEQTLELWQPPEDALGQTGQHGPAGAGRRRGPERSR